MKNESSPRQHTLRRILRLFPEEFRSRWTSDMVQLFDDQMAEARSPRERRRVWVETLLGAAATAPREHASILAQDLKVALRGMRSQLPTTLAVMGTRCERTRRS